MKHSTFLLCLAPTIALAEVVHVPRAVAASPSLQSNTPSSPLPEVQIRPQDELQRIHPEAQHVLHLRDTDSAQAKPDTLSFPILSKTTLSLRALKSSTQLTKRNEGTLGQTPWIGMAIGLTCTALAAVMLG